VTAVLVALGLASLYAAASLVIQHRSQDERRRRALRGTRSSTIAQLPEGEVVRVIGRAREHGARLRAPLTGRACLYYVVRVYDLDPAAGVVAEEARGVPFRLEDATGSTLIDPEGAEVSLEFDYERQLGLRGQPTEEEEAFLYARRIPSHGLVFNRRLRFCEAVIELDEPIAVAGPAVRELDRARGADEAYRGAPATRPALRGSPAYPLIISDDPSTRAPRR
jgi:hypothetical protein